MIKNGKYEESHMTPFASDKKKHLSDLSDKKEEGISAQAYQATETSSTLRGATKANIRNIEFKKK